MLTFQLRQKLSAVASQNFLSQREAMSIAARCLRETTRHPSRLRAGRVLVPQRHACRVVDHDRDARQPRSLDGQAEFRQHRYDEGEDGQSQHDQQATLVPAQARAFTQIDPHHENQQSDKTDCDQPRGAGDSPIQTPRSSLTGNGSLQPEIPSQKLLQSKHRATCLARLLIQWEGHSGPSRFCGRRRAGVPALLNRIDSRCEGSGARMLSRDG